MSDDMQLRNNILEWIRRYDKDAALGCLPSDLTELKYGMARDGCLYSCNGLDSCPTRGYYVIPMLYDCSVPARYVCAYSPCPKIADSVSRAIVRSRLTNCGIPERFKSATFDNFMTISRDRSIAYAKSAAQDCAAQGFSLTLMGTPGTGKTHLACAMVQSWLARGKAAVFVSVVNLLDEIKRGYDSFSTGRIEDVLCKSDFIALDDIGAQKETSWATERLWELIDRRYRERKPMVVTANANTREQLVKLAGERGLQIVSRLTDEDFGYYSILNDVDYRGLKNRNKGGRNQ